MFCNKCGTKIKEGALFCPHCGNKVSSSVVTLDDTEEAFNKISIEFVRPKQFFLINPDIKIDINNGLKTLILKKEQTKSIDIPIGRYFISFSFLIRKTDLDVEIKDNSRFEISFNRVSGQINVTCNAKIISISTV